MKMRFDTIFGKIETSGKDEKECWTKMEELAIQKIISTGLPVFNVTKID